MELLFYWWRDTHPVFWNSFRNLAFWVILAWALWLYLLEPALQRWRRFKKSRQPGVVVFPPKAPPQ